MQTFVDFLRENGLEPSAVTQVTISDWGRSVDVTCQFNPYGEGRPYHLLFRGCSHVGWEAQEDALDAVEPTTDILGCEVQAQRRGVKPHRDGDDVAVLATAAFELTISYTTFRLDMLS